VTTSGQNNIQPVLYGLVLAGGKSLRMGTDKGAMLWHGKEQKYYMCDLLQEFCDEVFISCRAEQQGIMDNNYKTIPDSVDGSGPIVAILSAFEKYSGVAWLVVACDLPLLDRFTVLQLVEGREPGGVATTFRSPFDQLPEPLITIWEPASKVMLWSHLADGFRCPRKALIRNEEQVKVIEPKNPDALMNANTPEDAETVKTKVKTG